MFLLVLLNMINLNRFFDFLVDYVDTFLSAERDIVI